MSYQIKASLAKAAAKLRGRNLTPAEETDLYNDYQAQSGTKRDKATKSLGRATNLTAGEIRAKRTSDDDCDRVLRDLENILDN